MFNDIDKREEEDIEFMSEVPAAMRYRGSPWAYVLSALLLVFFILFIIWSLLKERDEVTQGSGQIIPSLGVQPIQSEEGGVIKEILVRENQKVEKNEVVATISNVKAYHHYQDLRNKKIEYQFALQRLAAEQAGQDLVFTDEQKQEHPDVVDAQMRLFETRKAKYEGEGRVLEAELAQRKFELAEAEQRRIQYEKTLLLLREQEARVAPLVPHKYPEVDYIKLKQRIVTLDGEFKKLLSSINSLTSAIYGADERLKNREPERLASIAKEANEFRKELDTKLEEIKAGEDRVQKSELRSSVRGTVKRILLKPDEVAKPADLIMEILPLDDALEVEARFSPAHRGYLKIGQNATIKISAYDSSVYGAMQGYVTFISPDTIEDSKGEAWYEVRLRTTSSKLTYEGKDLDIKTGMTVVVDVISGKKSVFAYLMKPLFKSQQKGNVAGKAAAVSGRGEQPDDARAPQ